MAPTEDRSGHSPTAVTFKATKSRQFVLQARMAAGAGRGTGCSQSGKYLSFSVLVKQHFTSAGRTWGQTRSPRGGSTDAGVFHYLHLSFLLQGCLKLECRVGCSSESHPTSLCFPLLYEEPTLLAVTSFPSLRARQRTHSLQQRLGVTYEGGEHICDATLSS